MRPIRPLVFTRVFALLLVIVAGASAARAADGKKWALLVGINVYDHPQISPLSFAVADAQALAVSLRRDAGFPAEGITVLTSDGDRKQRPTRDNVLNALTSLTEKVGPDDTLLLYFSGHGFSQAEGKNYLASMNADPDDLENTCLPVKVLQEKFQQLKARHVVFIIDACRNSPSRSFAGTDANLLTGALSRDLRRIAVTPEQLRGRAILMACSEGQRAFEWLEKNQGAFTYFLLERMGEAREQGQALTVNDLAEYAQRKTLAWSRQRFPGGKIVQKPDFEVTGAPVIPLLAAVDKPAPVNDPSPAAPVVRPGSVFLSDFAASLRPTVPGDFGSVEMRGQAYPKSLWLGGDGWSTFVLQGKYDAFTATIGVNDLAEARDSQYVFQVYGDAARAALYTSPALKAGDRPIPVTVNVQQQQQLRLRVHCLAGGILPNQAWFGSARVEKGSAPPRPDVVYVAGLEPVRWAGDLGTPEMRSRKYDRSLWLGGDGEAIYQLRGKFDRFSATVGVRDDSTAVDATVVFQVYGDDAKTALYTSPEMKAGDIPHDVIVNVESQQQLRLRITGALLPQHAWWGDPRLEKGDAPPAPRETYVVDMTPVEASGDSGTPALRGRRYDRSRWIGGNGEEIYLLGGKYQRFLGTVGIDDAATSTDTIVRFHLVGDNDKVLASSPPVKAGSPPLPVSLDVTGVQRLTLKCEGVNGGLPPRHAWWADARLVKTAAGAGRQ